MVRTDYINLIKSIKNAQEKHSKKLYEYKEILLVIQKPDWNLCRSEK